MEPNGIINDLQTYTFTATISEKDENKLLGIDSKTEPKGKKELKCQAIIIGAQALILDRVDIIRDGSKDADERMTAAVEIITLIKLLEKRAKE